MSNEIKIRNTSADIMELFEDLLDKHKIQIPNEDRTGASDEACLYGSTYSDIEDEITEILVDLINKVKDFPNMQINSIEY